MFSFSPLVNGMMWLADQRVAFVSLFAGITTLLFCLTVSTAAI